MKASEEWEAYQREWPAANANLQAAKALGAPNLVKQARRALSALSDKYANRHDLDEPEPESATVEELRDLLQDFYNHAKNKLDDHGHGQVYHFSYANPILYERLKKEIDV